MQYEQNSAGLSPQQEQPLPQRLRPDQVLLKMEGLNAGIQRLPDGHQG